MPAQTNSRTFVLVHGGWGGSSQMTPIAETLRSRGHRVYVPLLSGVGARSHLLSKDINLSTHIDDVVNEILWEDLQDVVLLGHSYGGAVITGAADRLADRISALVYLDAFLPEDGQALMDIAAIPEMVGFVVAARERGDIAVAFPREVAPAFKLSEDELWKFTPHPLATFFEPIRLTGRLNQIPRKVFVLAEQWPDHHKIFKRLQQDPAWTTVSLPAGHVLQTEMPDRCVEILEDAARLPS